MFSCLHECCRSLPFIQLALHSSFHGRALWWVCGSCVFWTLPGAVCITHLPEVLGLILGIPEDFGLVWAFLVLQFGILHQGRRLVWRVQAAEKMSCENVPVFVLFLFL